MVDDRNDVGNDETVAQSADATVRGVALHAEVVGRPPFTTREGSRYRLGEQLGRGGMGEVLLAHDEVIGREVAVKRIRSEEPTAEELARFLREARLQGRLEHPAVVPVHDLAFDDAGKPYFVMKRISGTAMSKLLELLRRAGPEEADTLRRRLLRAFVDVCLAVELAHQKHIVHRDLKPANIMLGDYGEVYVLDWGIARLVTEDKDPMPRPSMKGLELETGHTRAGTVLGTPAYMAPEQLAGEPAGLTADVYSLGCILYEIAAGEQLHTGPRRVGEEPARPSHARADSPPELDVLCERTTRPDHVERGSARSLGEGVQAFLDGDRDQARRKSLAQ
jgi:serine/threonine-protein kinase